MSPVRGRATPSALHAVAIVRLRRTIAVEPINTMIATAPAPAPASLQLRFEDLLEAVRMIGVDAQTCLLPHTARRIDPIKERRGPRLL
jgi:hypothetical protein